MENPRVSITPITVRGYVLDFYKQVSNVKFLEILEEARWNHFDGFFESGMFLELGLAFVVVNVNIDYKGAAVLGDYLEVETFVERIGKKSVTLRQIISHKAKGEEVVNGISTFVIKDLNKGVAVEITGHMRDMLSRETYQS